MNNVAFRIGMGFFTCAGLLIFLAGCPSQQQTPASSAVPTPVISKADLENIRYTFNRRLHPESTNVEGNKELVLIDFREQPDRLRERLFEVKTELKRIVESKRDAKISEERMGDSDFSFRYRLGKNYGYVTCQLQQHRHTERNHWDILLHVKEEIRP